MSDLTSAGQPSIERSERIKRRKVEVHLLRLRASAIDAECDIEQMEMGIEKKRQQIEDTLQQIVEREKELNEVNQDG
jgi:hypothetical protein